MSMSLARSALLRRAHLLRHDVLVQARRQASTAEAAKEAAGQATSRASEGLSKVTSSAGSLASRAGSAATGMGGRLGSVVGAVQSLVPPTVYYSKVAWEMSKIVFETRKMAFPSGAQFQSYYSSALKMFRDPATTFSSVRGAAGSVNPSAMLLRVRNMSQADMVSVGVVAAEVVGFFTVGEMVGRLKIIGYRSSDSHGGH